jgi:hypothetical protein
MQNVMQRHLQSFWKEPTIAAVATTPANLPLKIMRELSVEEEFEQRLTENRNQETQSIFQEVYRQSKP